MRKVYEYFADGYRMASKGERGIRKFYLCFCMALVHIFLVGLILAFSYFVIRMLLEGRIDDAIIVDDYPEDWDLR